MKLLNFLKTAGTAVINEIPGGSTALAIVNTFLPDDEKLTVNTSANKLLERVEQLTTEQQTQLANAEINLEIEKERGQTSRYEAMCKADGQESRAKNVNKAMNALIWLSAAFCLATAYVYITEGAAAAFSYEMSAVFGTVTGTFTYVIRAYMGDLRKETESRHTVEDTKPRIGALAGVIQAIKTKT